MCDGINNRKKSDTMHMRRMVMVLIPLTVYSVSAAVVCPICGHSDHTIKSSYHWRKRFRADKENATRTLNGSCKQHRRKYKLNHIYKMNYMQKKKRRNTHTDACALDETKIKQTTECCWEHKTKLWFQIIWIANQQMENQYDPSWCIGTACACTRSERCTTVCKPTEPKKKKTKNKI